MLPRCPLRCAADEARQSMRAWVRKCRRSGPHVPRRRRVAPCSTSTLRPAALLPPPSHTSTSGPTASAPMRAVLAPDAEGSAAVDRNAKRPKNGPHAPRRRRTVACSSRTTRPAPRQQIPGPTSTACSSASRPMRVVAWPRSLPMAATACRLPRSRWQAPC
jgi:hypothetical protein